MTETEYVSGMLSRVKRFAQNYGVHVWFVAHPKQLSNWNPVRMSTQSRLRNTKHRGMARDILAAHW